MTDRAATAAADEPARNKAQQRQRREGDMNALQCLFVAACSTALLTPTASDAVERNAAGFVSYASHDELVKAAKAESGTLQVMFTQPQAGVDEIVKLFTATYGIKA